MTETTKRSLRVRKPPAYFTADSEDPEQIGYVKQTYTKYVSPVQEMNALAKLMSKFVNSVNKHLRQASNNDMVDEKATKQAELPNSQKQPKKNDTANQMAKKKVSQKIEVKDDVSKKSKELYSYKDQMLQQATTKDAPKNQQTNTREQPKPKQQNYVNNYNDALNAQYLNYLNHLNSQQQIAAMTNLQRNVATQALLQQQQQLLLNSNPFLRQPYIPVQPFQPIPQKQNVNKEKLFGRAAFHVAIAYHIHLKKIKQSGVDIVTSQALLDPTYNAKKLRGDYQQRMRTQEGNP